MKNTLPRKPVSTMIPTQFGILTMYVWPGDYGQELVVLTTQSLDPSQTVTVRVHSECLTGDIFGSYKCDCGPQKEKGLKLVVSSKNGMFIYHRQEGRGIGLYEKIRSYQLQTKGLDTFEANIALGHAPDQREYSDIRVALDYFNIKDIDLVTNNPSKVSSVSALGFNIKNTTPLTVKVNLYNKKYVETKQHKFKHGIKKDRKYFFSICYITQKQEIKKFASLVKTMFYDPSRLLCLGVQADNATLTNKVACKRIRDIFKEGKKYQKIKPVLHYSFKYSTDSEKDLRTIKDILPDVDYIQLNDLTSKYLPTIKKANQLFHYVNIILTDENMELLENNTFISIAKRPETFVCIDNSFGTGKNEEFNTLKEKIEKVIAKDIREVSVSGGFGPDTLETYFNLKNYYAINISVDAESQLKTDGKLDMEKAEEYLQKLSTYSLNT